MSEINRKDIMRDRFLLNVTLDNVISLERLKAR